MSKKHGYPEVKAAAEALKTQLAGDANVAGTGVGGSAESGFTVRLSLRESATVCYPPFIGDESDIPVDVQVTGTSSLE